MDTRHDQRILALVDAALERPVDQREAFVRESTGDDAALFCEVMATLGEEPEGLIAKPLREQALFPAPQRLGPYEIERELGRGGMGVVYLAHREDLDRKVAVKLLKRGMDTEQILKRFLDERRILAGLNHSNIASLFDGGAAEDGRPYLVMEYIDGRPIDVYCNEERLTIRERLGLFLKVCGAVASAHRNLVVHRDIKPNNLFVTQNGEPKLLDFGIAKVVEPTTDTPQTETAQRLLTPDYASPEQIEGGPVTIACDIYALGVMLFRLLSDQMPRDTTSLSDALGTQDDLSEISARRSIDPTQLKRHLSGDLEAIVRLALRYEPELRYRSVEAFADDIRAYLNGLPVQARRGDTRYRFGKYLKRNKFKVIAIAAAFLAITLFPLGFGIAQRIERQETTRALKRAEAVSNFLADLFEGSDPYDIGEELTVGKLLEKGSRDIQDAFADQPQDRAALLNTLGRVYMNLGDYTNAGLLLEEARTLTKGKDGYGRTLHNLAELTFNQGDNGKSRELFAAGLAAMNRENASPQDRAELLDAYGLITYYEGDYERAEALFLEAFELCEAMDDPPAETLISLNGNYALIPYSQGDYATAEARFLTAIQIAESRLGRDHPLTLDQLSNLGLIHYNQGRSEKARELFEEVLGHMETIFGDAHPSYAISLNNLGLVMSDPEQAIDIYSQALASWRRVVPDGHYNMAATLINLANMSRERKFYPEAENFIVQAIQLIEEQYWADHPELVHPLNSYSILLTKTGNFSAARHYLDRARRIALQHFGEDHLGYGQMLNNLGLIYLDEGEHEGAALYFQCAIDVYRHYFDDTHGMIGVSQHNIAHALFRMQDYESAVEMAEGVLSRWDLDNVDAASPFRLWWILVTANERLGREARAREAYERANELRDRAGILESDPEWRKFYDHPFREARHDL